MKCFGITIMTILSYVSDSGHYWIWNNMSTDLLQQHVSIYILQEVSKESRAITWPNAGIKIDDNF